MIPEGNGAVCPERNLFAFRESRSAIVLTIMRSGLERQRDKELTLG